MNQLLVSSVVTRFLIQGFLSLLTSHSFDYTHLVILTHPGCSGVNPSFLISPSLSFSFHSLVPSFTVQVCFLSCLRNLVVILKPSQFSKWVATCLVHGTWWSVILIPSLFFKSMHTPSQFIKFFPNKNIESFMKGERQMTQEGK